MCFGVAHVLLLLECPAMFSGHHREYLATSLLEGTTFVRFGVLGGRRLDSGRNHEKIGLGSHSAPRFFGQPLTTTVTVNSSLKGGR